MICGSLEPDILFILNFLSFLFPFCIHLGFFQCSIKILLVAMTGCPRCPRPVQQGPRSAHPNPGPLPSRNTGKSRFCSTKPARHAACHPARLLRSLAQPPPAIPGLLEPCRLTGPELRPLPLSPVPLPNHSANSRPKLFVPSKTAQMSRIFYQNQKERKIKPAKKYPFGAIRETTCVGYQGHPTGGSVMTPWGWGLACT